MTAVSFLLCVFFKNTWQEKQELESDIMEIKNRLVNYLEIVLPFQVPGKIGYMGSQVPENGLANHSIMHRKAADLIKKIMVTEIMTIEEFTISVLDTLMNHCDGGLTEASKVDNRYRETFSIVFSSVLEYLMRLPHRQIHHNRSPNLLS